MIKKANGNFLALWLLVLVVSHPVPLAADFASAMYDYGAENYTAAYDEFTRLASLGHKDSQFNLGAMYFRGQGTKKNNVEAYAWISLAAEDGDETRIALRDRLLSKLDDADRAAALERATALQQLFSEQALLEKLMPVYVKDEDSQYQLVAREKINPEYPSAAARIGLSGSVDIEYTIDTGGYVKQYRILDSTNKIFEESVIDAVKTWRYQPFKLGDQVLEVNGERRRIFFRMENDLLIEGETIEQYLDNLRYKAMSELAVEMYFYAYIAEVIPEAALQWEQINRWYFKAAQGGVPEAQYQLGRNLFYGKGCVADEAKAIDWLTRAARADNPAAQYLLAKLLLREGVAYYDPVQGGEWLDRAVSANYPHAKIKKSWLLATSRDEKERNGARALELVSSIKNYEDQFTLQQVLAASQAETGDFKAAQNTQRRVLKLARSLNLPVEMEQQRLDAYEKNTPWRE